MELKIRSITKSFEGLKVLDGITLDIKHGECTSIIGPSGCGKTTLLKIIGGVESADSGKISVKDPEKILPIIWQDHRLLPWLTVRQNIEFGLELSGEKKPTIVNKYIKLTKLCGYEDYFPKQLSEGMKKRTAIARALVVEPEVLLLDEPFASLDFQTKLTMYKEIKSLQKRLQLTAILVTHDTRDAVIFSDKIAIMTDKPSTIKKLLKLENYEYSGSFINKQEKEIWDYLK